MWFNFVQVSRIFKAVSNLVLLQFIDWLNGIHDSLPLFLLECTLRVLLKVTSSLSTYDSCLTTLIAKRSLFLCILVVSKLQSLSFGCATRKTAEQKFLETLFQLIVGRVLHIQSSSVVYSASPVMCKLHVHDRFGDFLRVHWCLLKEVV